MTVDQLQARLGHVFADARLLQEALTHRSFGLPNNERFEFLGDSILNCVTAIALFERFGELREGELSRVRASLVRQDALYRIALDLDLGDCLRLGEGELKSGGSRRPSILADAVEALFAAVFLDAGFSAAKAVVDRLYAPLLAEVDPLKPSMTPRPPCRSGCRGAGSRCRPIRWCRHWAKPTRRSSKWPAKSPNSACVRWGAVPADGSRNSSRPSSRSPQ